MLPRDSFLFIVKNVVFRTCPVGVECEAPEDFDPLPVSVSMVGSGFIVATDGESSYGITAGHLCDEVSPASVGAPATMPDGAAVSTQGRIQVAMWGGASYEAVVVEIYSGIDMCVVQINAALQPVRMASGPPRPGERVYTLAAPVGTAGPQMIPTFEGFYAGIDYSVVFPGQTTPRPMAAYTIPARPGSSGSPIFNSRGHLIGMTSMALVRFENFCLSPPFEAVQTVVNTTIARANASRRGR
jgi:S1-C subfamily serine protease